MQVLLISTYDLGRQPFGLASPAAWLRKAGVEVTCVDTSREPVEDAAIAAASFIAFYLPMHTATRLSASLIERARTINPDAQLCAYGLYAPLNAEWLRTQGVDHVLGPEAEEELLKLVNSQIPRSNSQATPKAQAPRLKAQAPRLKAQAPRLKAQSPESSAESREPTKTLPRLAFIQPDRSSLPPLDRYATLTMPDGSRRVVGSTDATRGCKHLCRHCPIVPVYQGQFRVVPVDLVLEDIRTLVAAGAEHISFGDPDFLNGPTHARRIVERVSHEFPGVSYDATIKIEHLLKHAEMLPMLRDTGCLFITSAVESVDDKILEKLNKGHTRADFVRVATLCAEARLTLTPTFVSFTPWTTLEGYVDLIETVEDLQLVEHVAPIQLAIRLLVTSGSALLDLDEVRALVEAFDPASLTWPWKHGDPRVDELQTRTIELVGADCCASRSDTFDALADLAHEYASRPRRTPRVPRSTVAVPTVDEPWYCCAEPVGV